jgi:NAD+ synthase (glutamine-hydrolysing)
MDFLGLPRKNIVAITMPGFGTSGRTYENACALIRAVGATFREVDIKPVAATLMKSIGHDPMKEDLVFQNSQAWSRKLVELAMAGELQATDLGTGDLSELMLGWCTMFGDHAAHYGVNAGVPKTLISYLIRWSADQIFKNDEALRKVLHDILETPISPELLSHRQGQIEQKTEEEVGPYELNDFFGYYFVRFGFSPSRIVRMCFHSWRDKYDIGTIKKWARLFLTRFFPAQMKRSVLPLGPKVGGAAISPRGDWRMPADVRPDTWLEDLAKVPESV